MKTSIRLALAGALIHTATAVVHFPFAKQAKTGQKSAASLVRRTVDTDIFWGDASYVVNVSVGTPPQSVSLELSSSSSDTWVIDDRSQYCSDYYYYSDYDDDDDSTDVSSTTSCVWGTFASNLSSSYVPQDSDEDDDYYYDFDVTYDDGSYAWGDYFNDVITLGGATVSNFTMGLVNSTDMYIGVLGIGYNDSTYSNLPNRLQEQGLINSTAYSIWVDDEQASSGNLLFGAIDTTKFDGSLTRVSSYYSYYQMIMEIASINGTTSKSNGSVSITYGDDDDDDDDSSYSYSSDYMFTATFSPPDTVSNLPTEVASQIWDMAGAYYDSSTGLALISCTAANVSTTNFTLQLGRGTYGPIITATMADLVIPASDIDMTTYSYYLSDETNVCLFGVQNGTGSYSYTDSYNLGSTLLRRTYSVFDLVNNEIAVAPVKFGATATSNIVPFTTYAASVPSSTMHCVYSNCYETSSDGTDSDDSESGDDDRLPSGVLSIGALIGVAAGIGLGALALGIIGFLIWKRRRNNSKKDDKEAALAGALAGGAPAAAVASHDAAREPGAAPEMSQAASAAPAASKGKGKAPEVPAPAALSSVEEHPESSTTAAADNVHDDATATAAQPSSSREA